METQKQDAPLYFGTFQNAKQVNINGGNFAIHHTSKGESNTDINIKKLFEHISTAALHNSRERVQQVPEKVLKNIVHGWSPRLRTVLATAPTESSLPPFDRLSTEDALSDVFKWLCDPLSSYSVVWMYENTQTQALLLANALARILQQHRLLSASYFFSAATDSASIIPTIAYQLAQHIAQAKAPIAQVVDQNLAVFTSRCDDQIEHLIINPLRTASDLCNESVEAPKVIIIHGLEDHNDDDNLFLDSLTRAVVALGTTHFPQKLLVLGQYTDRLQECFSNLASQWKIIQRPIQLHNVLEKEHEIRRKEKEIEERDKILANKEKSINARVETLRRELWQEAQLRNANLTGKLRGAELANDALRSEKEQLTERIAQFERERKQTEEDRTRLEHQLKRAQEDLTTMHHTHLQPLRNENKQLTERMVQLDRDQKQTEEYRTRLEHQSKQLQEDLTTVQHTHVQREQETREHQIGLENEVKRLQKEPLASQKKNTQLQSEQKATERRTGLDELQRLRKELELTAQRQRERGKRYQTDLTNQKQLLLGGRTEELRGPQAYLTTADQYSVADAVRLVEDLNAEIFHATAAILDELDQELIKNTVPLDDGSEVVMRVDRILGVALTKLLRKSEDCLLDLLQTAFQTSMVSYTKRIVSSWSSDTPMIEDIFNKIYAQVRETESQPISARWKQLTRATLQQRMPDHRPALLPGLVAELGDILIVAGHEEDTERLKQWITDHFADRLGTVLKLAQDLNKVVGQGFTSCDLDLLYADPDTAFNNTDMEDALQPAGNTPPNNHHRREGIICTTDLGLGRSERTKDGWKCSVLLKAKVILPSGLEEILSGPMI